MAYINERLVEKTTDVFKAIKAMKLQTFATQPKKATAQTSMSAELKHHRLIFSRLLIASSRHIDMREVLKYPLSPISLPLAGPDGLLCKTNKASLLHLLEGDAGEWRSLSCPSNSVLYYH